MALTINLPQLLSTSPVYGPFQVHSYNNLKGIILRMLGIISVLNNKVFIKGNLVFKQQYLSLETKNPAYTRNKDPCKSCNL